MVALTSTVSDIPRSDLVQETKVVSIPLTSLRKKADIAALLPSAGNGTDVGLVTGTAGTNAPTLQSSDPGGTSVSETFYFEFVLPPEYVDAGAVSIRVKGKMGTTIADGASTIDFNVYKDDRASGVSADLMNSAAYSINNLTAQQSDMGINAGTLTAGSKLLIVGTMASNDTGNLGAMVPTIEALEMVLTVKG